MVEADAEQMQQILINLALNALDAMPTGGALRVELETSTVEWKLRVRDTGPGISESVRTRLFEPFVTDKVTGVGLGLVVSRRFAEAHGGSLQVLPEGPGACFELRIPRRRETAVPPNEKA
jgi:two-component system sensor histidine kinase HydH